MAKGLHANGDVEMVEATEDDTRLMVDSETEKPRSHARLHLSWKGRKSHLHPRILPSATTAVDPGCCSRDHQFWRTDADHALQPDALAGRSGCC